MTILPELRARPAGAEGEADALWYHPGFCQFPLPPRPGAAQAWQRDRAGTSVSIEPGSERDRVPGGPMLRRLLMHLCDTAIRTDQAQIALGDSAAALAVAMNPPVPAGLVPALEAQATSLFGCRIVVATEGGPGLSVLDARGRPRAAGGDWRATVRLNSRFLDNLQREKVALDRAVVAALQSSALALDIYAWLAATLPARKDQSVEAASWPELQAHFGTPDQDADAFQAEFAAALALLRRALPGLDIDEDAIGVGFSARAATLGDEPTAPVVAIPEPELAAPHTPESMSEPASAEAPASANRPREERRFEPRREDRRPDDRRRDERRPDERRPDERRPDERRFEERRFEERPDRPRPDEPPMDEPRPDIQRPEQPRFDRDRDRFRADPDRGERQSGQSSRQTISLRSHITGLQQVVWLQRAQGRDNVVIEVTPGTRYDPGLATVLTLEPMVLQIAGGLHARDFERVSSWATANRDLIDAFWEGEIDNLDEILARVRKVPAPGADRWRV